MANLFKLISNWIRGTSDKLAKEIEDPVRDGAIAIEDSERVKEGLRTDIREFLTAVKGQEAELEALDPTISKWDDFAKKAAVAGNTEDVRKALKKKQNAENKKKVLEEELKENRIILEQTKQQLQEIEDKVDTAKGNFEQLKIRKQSAKLRQSMAGNTNAGHLADLDTLEEDVKEEEHRAEAWEEMRETTDKDMEQKYSGDSDALDKQVQDMINRAKKKTTEN